MHLSGKFEDKACPVTNVAAWGLTHLEKIYGKLC